MPELPEVETVKRGLESAIAGTWIGRVRVNRRNLRIPIPKHFEAAVTGARIETITRRAKYLLLHLDNGKVIIVHLGMSGKLLVKRGAGEVEKHDHVAIELSGFRFQVSASTPTHRQGRANTSNLKPESFLVFNDPRRFGLMTVCEEAALATHKLFSGLGVEPLEKSFTGAWLLAALKGKSQPIKLAIMDQRLVVGVGNVYASEALFLSRISPAKPAGKVTRPQSDVLVAAIKAVLRAAIKSGGSTLRDYVRSDGDVGYFQHSFKVYGRAGKPCLACKTPIRQITQGGRSTFYCKQCQRG